MHGDYHRGLSYSSVPRSHFEPADYSNRVSIILPSQDNATQMQLIVMGDNNTSKMVEIWFSKNHFIALNRVKCLQRWTILQIFKIQCTSRTLALE